MIISNKKYIISSSFYVFYKYLINFILGIFRKEKNKLNLFESTSIDTIDEFKQIPKKNEELQNCSCCDFCVFICPTKVINLNHKNSKLIKFEISLANCTSCLLCVDVCPDQFLSHSKVPLGVNSIINILNNKFIKE